MSVCLATVGCAKRDASEATVSGTGAISARAPLPSGAFFKRSWSVSFDDGHVDELPAVVFARANSRLRSRIESIFTGDDRYDAEVIVLPEVGGYRVSVLTRSTLSSEIAEELISEVSAALDYAVIAQKNGRAEAQPSATDNPGDVQ